MLGQVFAIARVTFIESLRQPIFLILVLLSGILQVFNTLLSAYSMGYSDDAPVSGDDKMLLDMGLATVLMVATLLAAFIATSVLTREIENKTALTVISKPVSRPLFIIGKYVGLGGAMFVGLTIMTIFFLLAIRHEVMSTARDTVDGPVLLFTIIAVLFSIGLGIWGNFFYGWVFPSTAMTTMFFATILGFVATMTVSQEWAVQSPLTDIKPQILIACSGVYLALFVLTAVAIAASTRLGQVMTITVCTGVLMLGLLSNYLIGRYAFENEAFGRIAALEAVTVEPDLSEAGEDLAIILEQPATADLEAGDSIYYGPSPEGIGMVVPAHEPFTGDPTDIADLLAPPSGPALIISEVRDRKELVIANAGGLPVERNPDFHDYVFLQPTEMNPLALVAWSTLPNLQFFWLIDPITQGHDIPLGYMLRVTGYSVVQVVGLLAVATFLFQRRDVG